MRAHLLEYGVAVEAFDTARLLNPDLFPANPLAPTPLHLRHPLSTGHCQAYEPGSLSDPVTTGHHVNLLQMGPQHVKHIPEVKPEEANTNPPKTYRSGRRPDMNEFRDGAQYANWVYAKSNCSL